MLLHLEGVAPRRSPGYPIRFNYVAAVFINKRSFSITEFRTQGLDELEQRLLLHEGIRLSLRRGKRKEPQPREKNGSADETSHTQCRALMKSSSVWWLTALQSSEGCQSPCRQPLSSSLPRLYQG